MQHNGSTDTEDINRETPRALHRGHSMASRETNAGARTLRALCASASSDNLPAPGLIPAKHICGCRCMADKCRSRGKIVAYAAQSEPERPPGRKRLTLLDEAFQEEIRKEEKRQADLPIDRL